MENNAKKPAGLIAGIILLALLLVIAIVAFVFTTKSMNKKV